MMCIEATDVKKISQLVFCLRWFDDNLDAHDEFISVKSMLTTDADSINWNLNTYCCGCA